MNHTFKFLNTFLLFLKAILSREKQEQILLVEKLIKFNFLNNNIFE